MMRSALVMVSLGLVTGCSSVTWSERGTTKRIDVVKQVDAPETAVDVTPLPGGRDVEIAVVAAGATRIERTKVYTAVRGGDRPASVAHELYELPLSIIGTATMVLPAIVLTGNADLRLPKRDSSQYRTSPGLNLLRTLVAGPNPAQALFWRVVERDFSPTSEEFRSEPATTSTRVAMPRPDVELSWELVTGDGRTLDGGNAITDQLGTVLVQSVPAGAARVRVRIGTEVLEAPLRWPRGTRPANSTAPDEEDARDEP